MRTVLITLIGPDRTSDLVVDADTPVAELLPSLLPAGGVPAGDAQDGRWTVAVTGKQPVASDRTLDEAGVLDGAVLVLRRAAEAPAPSAAGSWGVPAAEAGSPLQRTRAVLEQADGGPEQLVATAATGHCATVAVVSPKGGVGKTTVSILLGELLCSLRSDHVLALDGDSDYGSLGRVGAAAAGGAGVEGRDEGIFGALSEGAVTFAELDRTLWSLPGGLRIVPSPRDPAAMARATRSVYTRVIGSLQRLADVLVIDCGTGLGQPGVQAAILACDQLVLVTDPTGATATLAVEAGQLLERTGRPITVVANRLRRGRQGTEELLRLDALFPRAAGLVGIPEEAEAELALRGELQLTAAAGPLRQRALELAATLAAGWT